MTCSSHCSAVLAAFAVTELGAGFVRGQLPCDQVRRRAAHRPVPFEKLGIFDLEPRVRDTAGPTEIVEYKVHRLEPIHFFREALIPGEALPGRVEQLLFLRLTLS